MKSKTKKGKVVNVLGVERRILKTVDHNYWIMETVSTGNKFVIRKKHRGGYVMVRKVA